MADFLILDDNKNKTEENNKVVDNNKSTSSFIDKLNNFILTLQKIKTKEKVIFYRLLSTMTNA
ncbi:hypothetical protein HOG21_05140 [bacterium]|nr:hypothetical protein [bacterium]